MEILEKSYQDLEPLSRHWRKEFALHKNTLRLAGKYAGELAEKKILDVGCGLGILVQAFSFMGADSEGVDKNILVEWGLSGIEEMWRQKNIKVSPKDFFEAEIKENYYDVVISENVFEHLPYTQKEFLEKIFKILAPGGWLFLATPNLSTALKRARMVFGRSPYWDLDDFFLKKQPFGHFREFTGKELRRMAKLSGFSPVALKGKNIYFKWRWLFNFRKWPALAAFIFSAIFPNCRDVLYLVAKKPA